MEFEFSQTGLYAPLSGLTPLPLHPTITDFAHHTQTYQTYLNSLPHSPIYSQNHTLTPNASNQPTYSLFDNTTGSSFEEISIFNQIVYIFHHNTLLRSYAPTPQTASQSTGPIKAAFWAHFDISSTSVRALAVKTTHRASPVPTHPSTTPQSRSEHGDGSAEITVYSSTPSNSDSKVQTIITPPPSATTFTRCLCVAFQRLIFIYNLYDKYVINTPFDTASAWPLPRGILLQPVIPDELRRREYFNFHSRDPAITSIFGSFDTSSRSSGGHCSHEVTDKADVDDYPKECREIGQVVSGGGLLDYAINPSAYHSGPQQQVVELHARYQQRQDEMTASERGNEVGSQDSLNQFTSNINTASNQIDPHHEPTKPPASLNLNSTAQTQLSKISFPSLLNTSIISYHGLFGDESDEDDRYGFSSGCAHESELNPSNTSKPTDVPHLSQSSNTERTNFSALPSAQHHSSTIIHPIIEEEEADQHHKINLPALSRQLSPLPLPTIPSLAHREDMSDTDSPTNPHRNALGSIHKTPTLFPSRQDSSTEYGKLSSDLTSELFQHEHISDPLFFTLISIDEVRPLAIPMSMPEQYDMRNLNATARASQRDNSHHDTTPHAFSPPTSSSSLYQPSSFSIDPLGHDQTSISTYHDQNDPNQQHLHAATSHPQPPTFPTASFSPYPQSLFSTHAFASDPYQVVVHVFEECPFLVTYHTIAKRHCLYSLQRPQTIIIETELGSDPKSTSKTSHSSNQSSRPHNRDDDDVDESEDSEECDEHPKPVLDISVASELMLELLWVQPTPSFQADSVAISIAPNNIDNTTFPLLSQDHFNKHIDDIQQQNLHQLKNPLLSPSEHHHILLNAHNNTTAQLQSISESDGVSDAINNSSQLPPLSPLDIMTVFNQHNGFVLSFFYKADHTVEMYRISDATSAALSPIPVIHSDCGISSLSSSAHRDPHSSLSIQSNCEQFPAGFAAFSEFNTTNSTTSPFNASSTTAYSSTSTSPPFSTLSPTPPPTAPLSTTPSQTYSTIFSDTNSFVYDQHMGIPDYITHQHQQSLLLQYALIYFFQLSKKCYNLYDIPAFHSHCHVDNKQWTILLQTLLNLAGLHFNFAEIKPYIDAIRHATSQSINRSKEHHYYNATTKSSSPTSFLRSMFADYDFTQPHDPLTYLPSLFSALQQAHEHSSTDSTRTSMTDSDSDLDLDPDPIPFDSPKPPTIPHDSPTTTSKSKSVPTTLSELQIAHLLHSPSLQQQLVNFFHVVSIQNYVKYILFNYLATLQSLPSEPTPTAHLSTAASSSSQRHTSPQPAPNYSRHLHPFLPSTLFIAPFVSPFITLIAPHLNVFNVDSPHVIGSTAFRYHIPFLFHTHIFHSQLTPSTATTSSPQQHPGHSTQHTSNAFASYLLTKSRQLLCLLTFSLTPLSLSATSHLTDLLPPSELSGISLSPLSSLLTKSIHAYNIANYLPHLTRNQSAFEHSPLLSTLARNVSNSLLLFKNNQLLLHLGPYAITKHVPPLNTDSFCADFQHDNGSTSTSQLPHSPRLLIKSVQFVSKSGHILLLLYNARHRTTQTSLITLPQPDTMSSKYLQPLLHCFPLLFALRLFFAVHSVAQLFSLAAVTTNLALSKPSSSSSHSPSKSTTYHQQQPEGDSLYHISSHQHDTLEKQESRHKIKHNNSSGSNPHVYTSVLTACPRAINLHTSPLTSNTITLVSQNIHNNSLVLSRSPSLQITPQHHSQSIFAAILFVLGYYPHISHIYNTDLTTLYTIYQQQQRQSGSINNAGDGNDDNQSNRTNQWETFLGSELHSKYALLFPTLDKSLTVIAPSNTGQVDGGDGSKSSGVGLKAISPLIVIAYHLVNQMLTGIAPLAKPAEMRSPPDQPEQTQPKQPFPTPSSSHPHTLYYHHLLHYTSTLSLSSSSLHTHLPIISAQSLLHFSSPLLQTCLSFLLSNASLDSRDFAIATAYQLLQHALSTAHPTILPHSVPIAFIPSLLFQIIQPPSVITITPATDSIINLFNTIYATHVTTLSGHLLFTFFTSAIKQITVTPLDRLVYRMFNQYDHISALFSQTKAISFNTVNPSQLHQSNSQPRLVEGVTDVQSKSSAVIRNSSPNSIQPFDIEALYPLLHYYPMWSPYCTTAKAIIALADVSTKSLWPVSPSVFPTISELITELTLGLDSASLPYHPHGVAGNEEEKDAGAIPVAMTDEDLDSHGKQSTLKNCSASTSLMVSDILSNVFSQLNSAFHHPYLYGAPTEALNSHHPQPDSQLSKYGDPNRSRVDDDDDDDDDDSAVENTNFDASISVHSSLTASTGTENTTHLSHFHQLSPELLHRIPRTRTKTQTTTVALSSFSPLSFAVQRPSLPPLPKHQHVTQEYSPFVHTNRLNSMHQPNIPSHIETAQQYAQLPSTTVKQRNRNASSRQTITIATTKTTTSTADDDHTLPKLPPRINAHRSSLKSTRIHTNAQTTVNAKNTKNKRVSFAMADYDQHEDDDYDGDDDNGNAFRGDDDTTQEPTQTPKQPMYRNSFLLRSPFIARNRVSNRSSLTNADINRKQTTFPTNHTLVNNTDLNLSDSFPSSLSSYTPADPTSSHFNTTQLTRASIFSTTSSSTASVFTTTNNIANSTFSLQQQLFENRRSKQLRGHQSRLQLSAPEKPTILHPFPSPPLSSSLHSNHHCDSTVHPGLAFDDSIAPSTANFIAPAHLHPHSHHHYHHGRLPNHPHNAYTPSLYEPSLTHTNYTYSGSIHLPHAPLLAQSASTLSDPATTASIPFVYAPIPPVLTAHVIFAMVVQYDFDIETILALPLWFSTPLLNSLLISLQSTHLVNNVELPIDNISLHRIAMLSKLVERESERGDHQFNQNTINEDNIPPPPSISHSRPPSLPLSSLSSVQSMQPPLSLPSSASKLPLKSLLLLGKDETVATFYSQLFLNNDLIALYHQANNSTKQTSLLSKSSTRSHSLDEMEWAQAILNSLQSIQEYVDNVALEQAKCIISASMEIIKQSPVTASETPKILPTVRIAAKTALIQGEGEMLADSTQRSISKPVTTPALTMLTWPASQQQLHSLGDDTTTSTRNTIQALRTHHINQAYTDSLKYFFASKGKQNNRQSVINLFFKTNIHDDWNAIDAVLFSTNNSCLSTLSALVQPIDTPHLDELDHHSNSLQSPPSPTLPADFSSSPHHFFNQWANPHHYTPVFSTAFGLLSYSHARASPHKPLSITTHRLSFQIAAVSPSPPSPNHPLHSFPQHPHFSTTPTTTLLLPPTPIQSASPLFEPKFYTLIANYIPTTALISPSDDLAPSPTASTQEPASNDQTAQIPLISAWFFPSDYRLSEISKLLTSSRPASLYLSQHKLKLIAQRQRAEERELMHCIAERRACLAEKQLSLWAGRSMYVLATRSSQETMASVNIATEITIIQKMCPDLNLESIVRKQGNFDINMGQWYRSVPGYHKQHQFNVISHLLSLPISTSQFSATRRLSYVTTLLAAVGAFRNGHHDIAFRRARDVGVDFAAWLDTHPIFVFWLHYQRYLSHFLPSHQDQSNQSDPDPDPASPRILENDKYHPTFPPSTALSRFLSQFPTPLSLHTYLLSRLELTLIPLLSNTTQTSSLPTAPLPTSNSPDIIINPSWVKRNIDSSPDDHPSHHALVLSLGLLGYSVSSNLEYVHHHMISLAKTSEGGLSVEKRIGTYHSHEESKATALLALACVSRGAGKKQLDDVCEDILFAEIKDNLHAIASQRLKGGLNIGGFGGLPQSGRYSSDLASSTASLAQLASLGLGDEALRERMHLLAQNNTYPQQSYMTIGEERMSHIPSDRNLSHSSALIALGLNNLASPLQHFNALFVEFMTLFNASTAIRVSAGLGLGMMNLARGLFGLPDIGPSISLTKSLFSILFARLTPSGGQSYIQHGKAKKDRNQHVNGVTTDRDDLLMSQFNSNLTSRANPHSPNAQHISNLHSSSLASQLNSSSSSSSQSTKYTQLVSALTHDLPFDWFICEDTKFSAIIALFMMFMQTDTTFVGDGVWNSMNHITMQTLRSTDAQVETTQPVKNDVMRIDDSEELPDQQPLSSANVPPQLLEQNPARPHLFSPEIGTKQLNPINRMSFASTMSYRPKLPSYRNAIATSNQFHNNLTETPQLSQISPPASSSSLARHRMNSPPTQHGVDQNINHKRRKTQFSTFINAPAALALAIASPTLINTFTSTSTSTHFTTSLPQPRNQNSSPQLTNQAQNNSGDQSTDATANSDIFSLYHDYTFFNAHHDQEVNPNHRGSLGLPRTPSRRSIHPSYPATSINKPSSTDFLTTQPTHQPQISQITSTSTYRNDITLQQLELQRPMINGMLVFARGMVMWDEMVTAFAGPIRSQLIPYLHTLSSAVHNVILMRSNSTGAKMKKEKNSSTSSPLFISHVDVGNNAVRKKDATSTTPAPANTPSIPKQPQQPPSNSNSSSNSSTNSLSEQTHHEAHELTFVLDAWLQQQLPICIRQSCPIFASYTQHYISKEQDKYRAARISKAACTKSKYRDEIKSAVKRSKIHGISNAGTSIETTAHAHNSPFFEMKADTIDNLSGTVEGQDNDEDLSSDDDQDDYYNAPHFNQHQNTQQLSDLNHDGPIPQDPNSTHLTNPQHHPVFEMTTPWNAGHYFDHINAYGPLLQRQFSSDSHFSMNRAFLTPNEPESKQFTDLNQPRETGGNQDPPHHHHQLFATHPFNISSSTCDSFAPTINLPTQVHHRHSLNPSIPGSSRNLNHPTTFAGLFTGSLHFSDDSTRAYFTKGFDGVDNLNTPSLPMSSLPPILTSNNQISPASTNNTNNTNNTNPSSTNAASYWNNHPYRQPQKLTPTERQSYNHAISLLNETKSQYSDFLHPLCHNYLSIIAHGCLAIGFRFAGTLDTRIRDLLIHYLTAFHTLTLFKNGIQDDETKQYLAFQNQSVYHSMLFPQTGLPPHVLRQHFSMSATATTSTGKPYLFSPSTAFNTTADSSIISPPHQLKQLDRPDANQHTAIIPHIHVHPSPRPIPSFFYSDPLYNQYQSLTQQYSQSILNILLKDIDDQTLIITTGTLAVALGLVMCGSGDLASLRLLRRVRKNTDNNIPYAQHQQLSQAIGLLSLGGCALSIESTSPSNIAMLFCTLFPRYTHQISQHSDYLHFLRFFHVLSSNPRSLTVVDFTSKHNGKNSLSMSLSLTPTPSNNRANHFPIPAQVTITTYDHVNSSPHTLPNSTYSTPRLSTNFDDQALDNTSALYTALQTHHLSAPCLLPPLNTIHSITITYHGYLPIHLTPSTNVQHAYLLMTATQSSVVYLKKISINWFFHRTMDLNVFFYKKYVNDLIKVCYTQSLFRSQFINHNTRANNSQFINHALLHSITLNDELLQVIYTEHVSKYSAAATVTDSLIILLNTIPVLLMDTILGYQQPALHDTPSPHTTVAHISAPQLYTALQIPLPPPIGPQFHQLRYTTLFASLSVFHPVISKLSYDQTQPEALLHQLSNLDPFSAIKTHVARVTPTWTPSDLISLILQVISTYRNEISMNTPSLNGSFNIEDPFAIIATQATLQLFSILYSLYHSVLYLHTHNFMLSNQKLHSQTMMDCQCIRFNQPCTYQLHHKITPTSLFNGSPAVPSDLYTLWFTLRSLHLQNERNDVKLPPHVQQSVHNSSLPDYPSSQQTHDPTASSIPQQSQQSCAVPLLSSQPPSSPTLEDHRTPHERLTTMLYRQISTLFDPHPITAHLSSPSLHARNFLDSPATNPYSATFAANMIYALRILYRYALIDSCYSSIPVRHLDLTTLPISTIVHLLNPRNIAIYNHTMLQRTQQSGQGITPLPPAPIMKLLKVEAAQSVSPAATSFQPTSTPSHTSCTICRLPILNQSQTQPSQSAGPTDTSNGLCKGHLVLPNSTELFISSYLQCFITYHNLPSTPTQLFTHLCTIMLDLIKQIQTQVAIDRTNIPHFTALDTFLSKLNHTITTSCTSTHHLLQLISLFKQRIYIPYSNLDRTFSPHKAPQTTSKGFSFTFKTSPAASLSHATQQSEHSFRKYLYTNCQYQDVIAITCNTLHCSKDLAQIFLHVAGLME